MEKKFEMSYFLAPITNKVPLRTVNLKEVADIIRSTTFWVQTQKLRTITHKEEARLYKGLHFPYVTPAGVFSYCNDASIVTWSSMLCMDLDHVDHVDDLKHRLIDDHQFRTLMAFRSPSGDGLKWFVEVDLTKCGYRQWFDAVRNYLMATYGLSAKQCDPSVRNESRACFLCYDPEVYVNPSLTVDK
jgi:hypothetical protein